MEDDILELKSALIKLSHQWHLARYAYPFATFFSRLLPPDRQIQARIAVLGMALSEGKKPCLSLVKRLTAQALKLADLRYQSGDLPAASRLLASALQLYYHSRMVGALDSPLLADPNYSDLIRHSRFYQEIFEAAVLPPIAAETSAEPEKTGENILAGKESLKKARPLKILALSRYHYNFHFSLEHFDYLRKQGHTVTQFAMEDLSGNERTLSLEEAVQRGVRLAQGQVNPIPEQLRAAVNEADLIWVEWGNETAVLVSQWEVKKPVLVHIHQYESKSNWLHLLNLPGIDHICYSAPSALSISLAQRPEIVDVPHSYIPLGIEVNRFTTNKLQTAQYTVAQIGWRTEVKDTSWTIEVMRRVHEHDPKWKLLIVGPKPNPDSAWARKIYGQIAQYDWIEITGNWDKVENYLPQVGYIISASVQEGLHLAVAEAACAGCVPVVRNWPELLHYGAASAVYPHEWIVNSPEEATRRILELTTPDEKYRRWVEDNFNATTTNHEKEQLLLSLVGAAHRPVEQE